MHGVGMKLLRVRAQCALLFLAEARQLKELLSIICGDSHERVQRYLK